MNYDPKQPTLASLVPWRNPALVKIFFSFEFWFYLNFHGMIVFLSMSGALPLLPVDWKASGAFQYFTTFFLTFYNGNCYARYQKLYTACCDLMDSTLLFVREMTVAFKDETTWKHRLQATKWLLAAVDLFFMGVCGNKLSMKEWSEVVKKGLLTKPEAQLLLKYPGPEVVPILTTWVMISVADALELPTFHERKNPKWTCVRAQKIAHLHNRLDFIMTKLMASYRLISETMAQPIPFAYWHLMNLVFSLNFLLLALILASFQHWMTVIPYSMALLTFMGLREVSNQLADPFGDDVVDFPLAKYLDYTFDHSICLLQAFSASDAYSRVRKQVYASAPFNERQVRRHVKPENLYSEAYAAHSDSVYIWEKEQPLAECAAVYEKESLQEQLKKSLSAIPIGRAAVEYDDADFHAKAHGIEENQLRWLQEAEEELERLREAAPEAAKELEDLETRAEQLADQMLADEEQAAIAERNLAALTGRGSTTSSLTGAAAIISGPGRGDAGGGVGELLKSDSKVDPGAPIATPADARKQRKFPPPGEETERIAGAFQWGFQNHGRSQGAPSERSFRIEDVSFNLVTDGKGRLGRERGEGAKNDGGLRERSGETDMRSREETAERPQRQDSAGTSGNGADRVKRVQMDEMPRTHILDQTPLQAPKSFVNAPRESRMQALDRGSTFEAGREGYQTTAIKRSDVGISARKMGLRDATKEERYASQ